MDDKSLITALIEAKLLTDEMAEALSRDAAVLGKNIEDVLVERKMVADVDLAKIKAKIIGVPYKAIKVAEIKDDVLKIIPETTARTYNVLPLSREKNLLVVGMVHPDDTSAAEALRYIAKQEKLSLGVYLISQSDCDAGIRRYTPFGSEIEAAVKSANVSGDSAAQRRVLLDGGKGGVADEAPVIKIVATLLKEAVDAHASDIHIEPERTRVRVRFRLDGQLQEHISLPAPLHQPIISRVKVLSDLKIDESRVPQDGRFRAQIFGRDIDFRVATFPTPMGEKVAIRVLDPTTGLKNLTDLGLVGKNEVTVKEGIEKPYGMILITGPTGSGKTTTLYALLQLLNKEDVNIVSLEDPVEYFVEGVNQSQVHPEIGYDFASGLRQILRQDPDIIMVGEIRDTETAGLAVHAALTGHIVFSTLHTNNAVGVIPRLIDMKVDAFLLPSALNLMLGQRLVTMLCQACKKAEEANADISAIIKKELPEAKAPYMIYHAKGCTVCKGKGIVGRMALFEVLAMTRELSVIVASGASAAKIQEEAHRQGMITMRQDGIAKALQGLVAIEEVLKETSEE